MSYLSTLLALLYSFQTLVGQIIEGVMLEEVTTSVGKRGTKDNYLNFKIVGEEDGYEVSIGVAVLQQEGGKALGAGLRRLVDEEDRFDLTRGCLVRSKSKPINNYFMTTYLIPLIEAGGEFVELKEEEIKPLVAIHAVLQKRDSDYKVTEDQILQFITDQGSKYWLGSYNPLIKEILSDPSYQMPNDIDDEPESTVTENEDLNTDDLEELTELVSHE